VGAAKGTANKECATERGVRWSKQEGERERESGADGELT